MQQQPTGGGQYGVPDFVNSSANRPSPQPHMLGISEPQSQPSQQHTLQSQQQNIMQSRPPPPPQQLQQQQSSPPKGLDNISDSQSPISQRNIQSQTQNAQSTQSQQRSAFEQQLQLVPNNSFGDHDDAVLAAEDGERGPVGNRWPRQETLALLKIRSDMDAAFRDASLKGPLWEDVSRKLAELGYHRSAKKCKEKFENVQKYYKRTKDGRAGRQDGKSYRFFTQLEALHNNNSGNPMTTTSAPNTTSHMNQSSNNPRVNVSNALTMSTMTLAPPPRPIQMTPSQPFHTAPSHPVDLNPGPINSGMDMKSPFMYKPTFSSSSESSDDEYEEQTDSRKRKRSSSGTAKKMMTFFEQLIKQIMERQEMMQQKFLEAIEKREQDRMIREEAWKRQEMARLNREHEIMAQERSLAASRDAAFIAFLQKITGQTIQIPIVPPLAQSTTTVTTVPAMNETHNSRAETTTTAIQVHHQHQHHHGQHHGHHQQQQHHHQQDVMNTEQNDLSSFDPGSSRWPKPEVHALIRLRSSMESRYQDAGPKGPLWEEISNGMSKLGYNRSAKRCKEKWENINKYFKKVKESNKKRPEDAKTCPYFHQLDQLYKRKEMNKTPKLEHPQQQQLHNENPQDQQLPASGEKVQESQQQNSSHEILAIMPPPNPENKTANAQSSNQPTIPTSNGTTMQTTFYTSPDHGEKKQESLNMMDVMVDMEALQTDQPQQQQRHAPPAVEDYDTDKMDADEDDEDEEDEDEDDSENTSDQDPHQHHIQQHRHAIPAPIAQDQRTMEHLPFAQFVHETRNPAQNTAAATAAASSFMAMVHRLNPTENPEFKSSKA